MFLEAVTNWGEAVKFEILEGFLGVLKLEMSLKIEVADGGLGNGEDGYVLGLKVRFLESILYGNLAGFFRLNLGERSEKEMEKGNASLNSYFFTVLDLNLFKREKGRSSMEIVR